MRVGNQAYARSNKSFGLTTLRNRHVAAQKRRLHLSFRGKSGILHEFDIKNPQLARIVGQLRELPGQKLFQYLDEDGARRSIDSSDVNDYLREVSGREITAKDFRTWAATNLAVLATLELNEEKPTKKGSLQIVKQVAEQLGNTPAVCRKSYIHPMVLENYLDGALKLKGPGAPGTQASVSMVEREVIRLLAARPRDTTCGATLKAALKASLTAAKSKRAALRSALLSP